jgi:methyl-accepting chemotaxis protein-1 (serine sensor receptor)
MNVADKMADGQLGHDIDASRRDEFGTLLNALKRMDEKLHEIVGGVRNASDAVGGAASELSRGNDDLSQRTQEQASALEETASSMEEMTATVKQNADNARQANQLATGARGQAERGGEVVSRAVGAMTAINDSSRKIADIISVIDEIAFQTNLLALNAAVEAARAGEQGRGFAVVASEVRSLAQRSATAAKEIKDLIGDSVEKVRTGSGLVDESGKVLGEIMESVKKVSDIVAEIAAASEEQAQGIDQVNNAVTQMDDTTQQNAALVEEAASAAKSMEQQAQQLVTQISFFRSSKAMATASASSRIVATKPTATVKTFRPAVQRRAVTHAKPVGLPTAAPALGKASGDDSSWQEF